MILNKNKLQLISLSVIFILFISFSITLIHSSLSKISKINSITLNYDFSPEQESPEYEEDVNEDCLDLFFLNNQKLKFKNFSQKKSKSQSLFLIPRIFYDIQLLPPEAQVS